MRTLLQDLRYGGRVIRKQPGYSLLIVLTLALAIGANTVIFSFANVLVLRPLPMKDPGTLAWLFMLDPQRGTDRGQVSMADFLDYRNALQSFETLAATTNVGYTMTGRGDAVAVSGSHVTANLIEQWGLRTIAGRGFVQGDDLPGAPRVAVLTHQFWSRTFGADPGIVGQSITLNGRPHTVIGVLDPAIEIGNMSLIDVWTPLTLDQSVPRDRREIRRVIGRLKPGVSFEQANVEAREVSRRLQKDHPATNAGWEAHLLTTKAAITGTETFLVLSLLVTVVGFVLLIACANIANLVLARATGRRRELAVRAALGASRVRMVRQLLTESVLLGMAGGALGLALAYAGLYGIRAAAYEPFFKMVTIDRTVLAFTAMLALVTPIVFSLLPALHAARTDVNETLKESSTRAGGGLRGRRSRSVLVVSQLTLAMMLLIVSGLLVRALVKFNTAPAGFDRSNILVVRLELPEWRYGTEAAMTDFRERLLGRLDQLSGARSVATTNRLPLVSLEATSRMTIEGMPASRPEDRPWTVPSVVSERYLATLGVPLIAGRTLEPRDDPAGMPVALVNAEAASRYWREPSRALGARIQIEGDQAWRTIVGVTANVKRADMRGVHPEIYVPARQRPRPAMFVLLRANGAEGMIPEVRAQVRSLDADVPIREIRTYDEILTDENSSGNILTGLFVAFAALALALAASGLYGVVSYSVSQRVQEIGIRMALGAVSGDIRRMIVRQTLVLVAIGGAAGLAGGAALAQLSASLLYDVTPWDPVTYATVAAIMAIVTLLAAFVPVRRASRIDPLLALRTE